MVGGTIFHRRVIQREISRVLVLNLLWHDKTGGACAPPSTTMPLTETSLLSRASPQPVRSVESEKMGQPPTRSTSLISTAESALAGIVALVPVESGPTLSRMTPQPQRCCLACGTTLHGRSAPGNNLPIRLVLTTRRFAPDRPLDHRARQSPRHD